MIKQYRGMRGFTLLEVMLVLLIGATLLGMFLNYTSTAADQAARNKTSIQTQEIINAALAYYLQYGSWPGTKNTWTCVDPTNSALISGFYLPQGVAKTAIGSCAIGAWLSPYRNVYLTSWDGTSGNFYVITQIPTGAKAPANSLIISGLTPLGVTTTSQPTLPLVTSPSAACAATGSCYVMGGTQQPGQNLMNARSANFAGVYAHGACVPAPQCPAGLKAFIYAAAGQVTGSSDTVDPTKVYPIEGFMIDAVGKAGNPYGTDPVIPSQLGNCGDRTSNSQGCPGLPSTATYWRVCMKILTQNTDHPFTNGANSTWGGSTTIVVFTRCAPLNENSGTPFTTYQND